MVIEHEELAGLVPHKGKMFIIDRISYADPENWTAESETKITENFMFYDEGVGGVPNYSCFEIIAQTISSLTGICARENGLKPNMGMILSVSGLKFDFSIIKSGQVVKARAVRETVLGNVYSFAVEVYIDEKISGSGKLTVMEIVEN